MRPYDVVLETLRNAIPLLGDVTAFMLWFVVLATVAGVTLFGGKLSSRQYSPRNAEMAARLNPILTRGQAVQVDPRLTL